MTLEMIGTQSIHPDYSNLHKLLRLEYLVIYSQLSTIIMVSTDASDAP